MPENTHQFEIGETFDGDQRDERIEIVGVGENTVTWDYYVDGGRLGRRTVEKSTARTLLRTGMWREPTTPVA
jgi:hypothetical protein